MGDECSVGRQLASDGNPAILYHYAPRGAPVLKEGLLSPAALAKRGGGECLVEKYGERAAKRLGIKDPGPSDVLEYLEDFRGKGGSRMISALLDPVPADAPKPLQDFAAGHDLYAIDYAGALNDGLIEGARVVEGKRAKTEEVEPEELINELEEDRPDYKGVDEKRLFAGQPHAMIQPKKGEIPPKYLSRPLSIRAHYIPMQSPWDYDIVTEQMTALPWSGKTREFLERFPGGLREWREWRRKALMEDHFRIEDGVMWNPNRPTEILPAPGFEKGAMPLSKRATQVYATDSGKEYDVGRLIRETAGLSVHEVEVDKLKALLKEPHWGDYSPMDVLENPERYPEEMKRVMESSLDYPILMTEDGELVDGGHRLLKAVLTGESRISLRVVPSAVMENARIAALRPFSGVPLSKRAADQQSVELPNWVLKDERSQAAEDANDPLEIKESDIHGFGLFAAAPFEKGDTICRVLRHVRSTGIADFDLLQTRWGRKINHADAPNAEPFVDEETRDVLVRAKRDIAKGDEITVNYEEFGEAVEKVSQELPAESRIEISPGKLQTALSRRRRSLADIVSLAPPSGRNADDDSLVDVRKHGLITEDGHPILLDAVAADALAAAQKELPKGVSIMVMDGFRSQEDQARIVRETAAKLKKSHPDDWKRLLKKYTGGSEELRTKPGPMDHRSGRAVDIKLVGSDGEEIDLGGMSMDESDRLAHYEGKTPISEREVGVRDNRRLLKNIMEEHGFNSNPDEWWHWGYKPPTSVTATFRRNADDGTIMALSVKQPWANLIASGKKTIETRGRPISYRGPLLVVSSKNPPEPGPAGCAVAIAELTDCRPMTKEDEKAAMCACEDGRWAWVLQNVRPVDPYPVRGYPGLYRAPPPKTAAAVKHPGPRWQQHPSLLEFLPERKRRPPGFKEEWDTDPDGTYRWTQGGVHASETCLTVSRSEAEPLLNLANAEGWRIPYSTKVEYDPQERKMKHELALARHAEEIGTNRRMRLGRFLKRLRRSFTHEDDQATISHFMRMNETAPKKSEWMLVVSAEPADLRTISTGRGWTSCMEQQHGPTQCVPELESSIGARDLVAYAVDRKGNWLARSVLRFDGKGGWWPDQVYGQPSSVDFGQFRSAAEEWLSKRGILGEKGRVSPHFRGYSDQIHLKREPESPVQEPDIHEVSQEEPPEKYRGTGLALQQVPPGGAEFLVYFEFPKGQGWQNLSHDGAILAVGVDLSAKEGLEFWGTAPGTAGRAALFYVKDEKALAALKNNPFSRSVVRVRSAAPLSMRIVRTARRPGVAAEYLWVWDDGIRHGIGLATTPRLAIRQNVEDGREIKGVDHLALMNELSLAPQDANRLPRGFVTYHDDGSVEVSTYQDPLPLVAEEHPRAINALEKRFSLIPGQYRQTVLSMPRGSVKELMDVGAAADDPMEDKDMTYEEYFRQKMREHGITGIDHLSDEKKRDFFEDVDRGWTAEHEKTASLDRLVRLAALYHPDLLAEMADEADKRGLASLADLLDEELEARAQLAPRQAADPDPLEWSRKTTPFPENVPEQAQELKALYEHGQEMRPEVLTLAEKMLEMPLPEEAEQIHALANAAFAAWHSLASSEDALKKVFDRLREASFRADEERRRTSDRAAWEKIEPVLREVLTDLKLHPVNEKDVFSEPYRTIKLIQGNLERGFKPGLIHQSEALLERGRRLLEQLRRWEGRQ